MTTRTTKRSAGEPTWIDLATTDLAVAKNFYQQVFGWEFFDTGPDFGHYHFALSQGRNAAGVGLIWPPDSPQPSAWTIYFASDDAAADSERVKALGGQVMVEPMTIGDSGAMAICVDPTGAVFGTITICSAATKCAPASCKWIPTGKAFRPIGWAISKSITPTQPLNALWPPAESCMSRLSTWNTGGWQ